MRQLFTAAIVLVSVLMTGCIDILTKIDLNKDGSGTVTERVVISAEVVKMIREFSAAFSDSGSVQEEEFSLFKESEIKAKASDMGEGVSYISGERIETDGREGFIAEYKFENINSLRINQNPENFLPALGEEVSLDSDNRDGLFTFRFEGGEIAELQIIIPSQKDSAEEKTEKDAGEETDSLESDSLQFAQLKGFIKDMRFAVKLNIDGEIVETNASFVEGNEISLFEIDFQKLFEHPEAFERFKEIRGDDIKSVEAAIKSIPGIKVELGPEVIVKIK